MVSAECDWAEKDMIAAGRLDPRFYAESRPALAEAEAARWVIDYAELLDAEVYIVHMSCERAVDAVRAARERGVRVWGETPPIYLGLTSERYDPGGIEAAKVIGAPPLRALPDQAALWDVPPGGGSPDHRQRQHLVDGGSDTHHPARVRVGGRVPQPWRPPADPDLGVGS